MNWIGLIFCAMMIAQELYFNRHHIFTAGVAFYVSVWGILIPSTFIGLFNRLELDPDYLRVRGLFKTKKVPLSEVIRIRNFGITTGQLVIEFTPPKAEQESIVVNPKDRIGFVSALRQFVPQAAYEL